MATIIYVGNLPIEADEREIGELFHRFGGVLSVRFGRDTRADRDRGYAFVEMSEEDADEAIGDLDGTDFRGRTLRVSRAKGKRPRGKTRSGYSDYDDERGRRRPRHKDEEDRESDSGEDWPDEEEEEEKEEQEERDWVGRRSWDDEEDDDS